MEATVTYELDLSWADRAEKAADVLGVEYCLDVANMFAGEVRRLISVEGNGFPSDPGQPPHKQTGNLLDSIGILKFALVANGAEIQVGAQAGYSAFLEYGTRKMMARPFMSMARRKVATMLTGLANLEGKDYTREWEAIMQQTNPEYPNVQVMSYAGERSLRKRILRTYRATHGYHKYFKR